MKEFFSNLKWILAGAFLAVDYYVVQAWESFKTIYDTRISLLQMQQSNAAYIASKTLQTHDTLFWIGLILINLIVFCLLFGRSISEALAKKDTTEE